MCEVATEEVANEILGHLSQYQQGSLWYSFNTKPFISFSHFPLQHCHVERHSL